MENHRLKPMVEGYSEELFNKLYEETKQLRKLYKERNKILPYPKERGK